MANICGPIGPCPLHDLYDVVAPLPRKATIKTPGGSARRTGGRKSPVEDIDALDPESDPLRRSTRRHRRQVRLAFIWCRAFGYQYSEGVRYYVTKRFMAFIRDRRKKALDDSRPR